ncbi:MAG: bifunctional 3-(3-hydroxy-phenyl)propionate/3-hydroxycinnamic acid hydroxylase [Ilumatobacteraceae bacterium]
MEVEHHQVLIVGAGPVGLTLANFLGRAGVRCLVIEQQPATSDEPRAVNLDDESLRSMQAAGLDHLVASTILPTVGTKYIAPGGKTIAFAHPKSRPQGHWPKNVFVQPDFDAMLAVEAAKLDSVAVHFSTALTSLTQDASGVVAGLRGSDGSYTVRADWVVGCDGGRSTTRELLGVRMRGSTFEQPWIVVDTVDDPNRHRYSKHHLDPHRPFVVVPGRNGRCRYEFMLLPGESAEHMLSWPSLEALLRPHREVVREQVIRSVVYTFHALLAERWRVGRVFLAGDAAHMMPPMAGQGLNSGIRDAHNLSWKLAMVVAGQSSPDILDTYEEERRAHAAAMIRMSTRMGRILMTTSRPKAALIRWVFAASKLIPPANRYVTEMRFKPPPAYSSGLLQAPRKGSWLGRLLPQPPVMLPEGAVVPLDDVLGTGFCLVAVGTGALAFDAFTQPIWDVVGARRIELALDDVNPLPSSTHLSIADVDEKLAATLARHVGDMLLVRPDRYVAGVCRPNDAASLADWFERSLGRSQHGPPMQPARPRHTESSVIEH